jgi:hypothetical protein
MKSPSMCAGFRYGAAVFGFRLRVGLIGPTAVDHEAPRISRPTPAGAIKSLDLGARDMRAPARRAHSRLKPVADPPHGLDVARLGGVVLDFRAKPADVDGDGRCVCVEGVLPDRMHQLIA